ncbi:MAG: M23 family metallopeptidase [Elusimicrobiota bacterium]
MRFTLILLSLTLASLSASAALAVGSGAVAVNAPVDEELLRRRAADYLAYWKAGRYDAMYGTLTKKFQAQISSSAFKNAVAAVVPFELVRDSATVMPGKAGLYWFELKTAVGNLALEIWFTPSGRIAGQGQAQSGPGASPFPSPHSSRVLADPFYFPFTPATGEWFLGGTHHRSSRAQRYAMDFVIVRGSETYNGDVSDNRSFFAYDQEIRCPSDGVVVDAHDGEPDNIPRKTFDGYLGNYAVVKIADDAFILFAHIKPGTLGVAKGGRVRAKQSIGRVGNSGHSTEPHLHMHVTDAYPVGGGWEKSDAIPMEFSRVTHNGKNQHRAAAEDGDLMSASE